MDKSERRYALEERAAIREYEAGMTRWLAQESTAKDAGFNSWAEAMRACNAR